MPNPASTFQRSFAGGELAPALSARADQAKYQMGLRTCRNFIVQRQGGVANRAGLRFVGEAKGGGSTANFLLRYVAEVAGDSVLIEAGPNYLRFYKNGGLVTLAGVVAWNAGTNYQIGDIALSGGVNYYCIQAHINQVPPNAAFWYAMPSNVLELPTGFGTAGFKWKQNGNTITLTGQLHQPQELIYVALTQWVIRNINTAPAIDPPTALGAVGGGVAGVLSYVYVVTAAAADTFEESIASAPFQLTPIGVPTVDQPNVLTWTPPAQAAEEYYIYCDPYGNGTYGFIGTATGATTFNDVGFTPDFTLTPPLPRVLFNATGDYPGCSATYQQRRLFARSINNPDAIFGSRTGFPSNFNISSPLQDDDAITFRIAGNQHNPVRDMVGLKAGLIVLTDGGEWTVVGGTTKVLSPNSIDGEQETYAGVADIPAVVVGNAIIYIQARGSIMRELRFDQQVEGLAGKDLTLFAAHLFDGFTVTAMDFQQTPNSVVWVCRSDGKLLGLTYIPEQEIWGWHRHDTGASGFFQSVCTVPEPGEDAVYVMIRRSINGGFHRYIERLERRTIQNFAADSFFVDSGLTYSGAPATAIGGLTHLIGEVVAVVADGVVIFDGDPTKSDAVNYTVDGAGNIPHVLTVPASVIHAGLPIRFAEIELLDLDVEGAAVRDKEKRVGSISLLLDASVRTFQAGPSTTRLLKVKLAPAEIGLEGAPFTGQEEISLSSDYNRYGRVVIRQTDPLPLTILGVLPNLVVGG
jgi:hypothetical protein